MRKASLVIMVVLLLGLALVACAPANSLEGTVWVLTELDGTPVRDDTMVTMIIDEDTIGGIDGCNHYGVDAEVAGGVFALSSPIASTLMACEQPIMDQANAYAHALTQATAYQFDGDQLLLLDAQGGQLALFQAQNG